MRKHLQISLLALLLLALFSTPALALAHVQDDAGLFSATEAQLLENELAEAEELCPGYSFFVLTTNDAGGLSAQQYADEFYDLTWGHSSGTLYLIDMDNREIYLCTTADAEYLFSNSDINTVLDAAFDPVSRGDYAGSAMAYAQTAAAIIYAAENSYSTPGSSGSHYTPGYDDYYQPQPQNPVARFINNLNMEKLLIALAAAAAAAGIFAVSTVSSYKSVNHSGSEYPLSSRSTLQLTENSDTLVSNVVTHRVIPQNNNRGGGGGGGHHMSSRGFSHGGGGRKF